MAKRMTPEEEAALVAEVEAHIGDETYWDFEHPLRAAPVADVRLPVTIPASRFRALARLAAAQGLSLPALIEQWLDSLDVTEFEAEPGKLRVQQRRAS